jgi:DNA-binding transcriptional regulator YdaS (Cro superfamily)
MADASIQSRRKDALQRLSLCKPTHAPPVVPDRSHSESSATSTTVTPVRGRSSTDVSAISSKDVHETVVLIRNGRVLQNADASQDLSNEHKRAIAKAVKVSCTEFYPPIFKIIT